MKINSNSIQKITMKIFLFVLLFLVAGCTPPTTNDILDNQWTCKHLYDRERTYIFDANNIKKIQPQQCSAIIMRDGACPVYIRIVLDSGETIWFTEAEWENYTCNFEGENHETRKDI